ncbi:DUF1772 domain-containing protein [Spirosoma aerolatum]|uniref:DUF1772 domain-containing protein n=1 Tax=Spirosoma aerolatum TaxID=1211326 RepID=UPI0009AD79A7|nr:DUF1772 domain-containing protein [Spirosoma aerolatum]
MAETLLILFILNLGTAFGAGLYESQIVIPHWFPKSVAGNYQVNPSSIGEFDVGRRFWAFVTTLPLTLLTLANLVVAWQAPPHNRTLWLAAALIALIERISTFAFFIPTIIRLQNDKAPDVPKNSRLAALWISANYLRNALVLVAWILVLLVISN